MSYNERFGLGLLVVACLYMAGLNLWLLFKDWFNERYNRKDDEKKKEKQVGRVGISKVEEKLLPDFVGKSKLNEEQEQRKQDKLEQEVKDLKTQLEEVKKNQLLFSIPLEKEPIPPPINDQSVSSEEEIILHSDYDREDGELASSQSFTADEFELMAKSLSGKVVTKQEEQQVAKIIPKMKGTDIYQQFIGQVKGAESKAMDILRMSEENESDNQSGMDSLSKFIRT